MPPATFYLGRVTKLGSITSESLLRAILEPAVAKFADSLFTITDVKVGGSKRNPSFVYGRLTKYKSEGEIEVVEPAKHIAQVADIPNLLLVASPFIYVPQFSGIAYQNIWNKLRRDQFEKVFTRLVDEKHNRLFAESSIEPVSDLRTFVQNVSRLRSVTGMEATVHPPNPLFGILWDSLRLYMRERKAVQVRISEHAAPQESLNTHVPELVEEILDGAVDEQAVLSDLRPPPSIADAAVLMAADGYGKARIEGMRDNRHVVIRTQDSQVLVKFEQEPEPDQLYAEVRAAFQKINRERRMKHDE